METVFTTSVRTLFGFTILLVLTRILGKKQLSHMTFFTYITGIALGNIAGDMVVHRDIKLIDGFTGLTLWAALTLFIEYINLKFPKARVVLDGEPSILIKKGRLMEKVMASNKINMDDLSMLLRTKNIFSVQEVDYAILEPNGQLSVLKKVENEPLTKKDSSIVIKPRLYIPTELIVDGKMVKRNLTELNLTEEWLLTRLRENNIQSIEDIFFAELQSDGSIFIDNRKD